MRDVPGILATLLLGVTALCSGCTSTGSPPSKIGYAEFSAGAFEEFPAARAIELELNGKGWILQLALDSSDAVIAARVVSVRPTGTKITKLSVESLADARPDERGTGWILRYPAGDPLYSEYSYGVSWLPEELGGCMAVGYPREESYGGGWLVPSLKPATQIADRGR